MSSAREKFGALEVVMTALLEIIRNDGQLPFTNEPDTRFGSITELAMEYGKYMHSEANIEAAIQLLGPRFPELKHIFYPESHNG